MLALHCNESHLYVHPLYAYYYIMQHKEQIPSICYPFRLAEYRSAWGLGVAENAHLTL
jgi:hypothetical protein